MTAPPERAAWEEFLAAAAYARRAPGAAKPPFWPQVLLVKAVDRLLAETGHDRLRRPALEFLEAYGRPTRRRHNLFAILRGYYRTAASHPFLTDSAFGPRRAIRGLKRACGHSEVTRRRGLSRRGACGTR